MDLQTNSTIGIFMIQGMNLRRGEAAKALLSYKASLYGALSILFITPLFGAQPAPHKKIAHGYCTAWPNEANPIRVSRFERMMQFAVM